MEFKKVFKFYIGLQLIYKVVLASGIPQSDSLIHIYIHLFFFKFFSYLGYYRILIRIPYAIC